VPIFIDRGTPLRSKSPLRTKDVWSIRTKLQVEKRTRDLAMFNLAIDSGLRGCDVVSLKVEDVAPHGTTVDRATIGQRSRPVRIERTDPRSGSMITFRSAQEGLVNFSFLADATRTAA
jgi:site-specific recombinase XerD